MMMLFLTLKSTSVPIEIYDVGISVAYLPFIEHPVLSVIVTVLMLHLNLICVNSVMCGNSH